ncbi:hypothetical protein AMAG_03000 [Allomyces macrogynus ATCC 38327]|uniref:Ethanolamine ammonia-lyase n=1 Tax=Allomyces macrogynus (strain ATCC 38327) TaxID=578462 RepID=A0A0L0S3Y8_ALLM3|nr:hypothetical protein AMAG_03000 [Allomyces macrogynus ATCC 38327]|eukprot:KNE57267.1 hypothetical protein AMAG_03000 [Allomyces macrogynus ATCC 38327]
MSRTHTATATDADVHDGNSNQHPAPERDRRGPANDGTDPPNPVRLILAEAPTDLRRLFGLASEFKEGDDALGIASHSPAERDAARLQLSLLRVGDIRPDRFSNDRELADYAEEFGLDLQVAARIAGWTLGELREFLVDASEDAIRAILPGLRSEVIAGVVKLMSNDDLICVASKIWNPPAPGSTLGTHGRFASRIQPNSATDDPEEVLMSVLEGLSYGCGDAIFGINIVASDLPNVATLEAVLLDVIQTFQLGDKTKHCVLAHLDEQMAVHAGQHRDDALRRSRSPAPSSSSSNASSPPPAATERSASPAAHTAAQLIESTPGHDLIGVAFQSIGGTLAVNRVFGISVASLRAAATKVPALYYETGQGSAVTNGASNGIDMVTCEARAHGLARALRNESRNWTIVNSVVGFIGPEVHKSRDQLLRACLEDLCMGKLHGLTFGLDICATYHMDITLDDIEFIQDAVLAAGPAFYMAVAGRNDPMLSYITTGFRDHPRLRLAHGVHGTDEMRDFFVHDLGVMNYDGSMTGRAGDTAAVYAAYRHRKGDTRPHAEIIAEGRAILEKMQRRGLDLGYGHDGAFRAPPTVRQRLQEIYDGAKRAVRQEIHPATLRVRLAPVIGDQPAQDAVELVSEAQGRDEYLRRPVTGERLTRASLDLLAQVRAQSVPLPGRHVRAAIVISDGLNADSIHAPGHVDVLVEALHAECAARQIDLPFPLIIVRNGRVRAGYVVGCDLFSPRAARDGADEEVGVVFHVIGERPGNGQNSLSVYLVAATPGTWAQGVDHNHARVVSGVSATALDPRTAARECLLFVDQVVERVVGARREDGALESATEGEECAPGSSKAADVASKHVNETMPALMRVNSRRGLGV